MTEQHWSEGYASDLAYTHGYYDDLNPRRAAFLLLLAGIDAPPPGPCCELGFGQGVSLAMHAAGDPSRRWWGTDLLPEQVLHARRLTEATDVGAVVEAQSFETFCARDDLPMFAFVGLHGIWSWISEANRHRIVDFLRRRLLPGGVVYIGHNALAGWASMLPLRQLMRDHLRWMNPPGRNTADRVLDAVGFAQRALAIDAALHEGQPVLRSRADDLTGRPPSYLMQEYMTRDFAPMAFTQMADLLDAAQLQHATPTELNERLSAIQLTPAQQAMLDELPHPAFRESVRELFVGQRFRRDLWVRGRNPLTRREQLQRLQSQHLVLAVEPADVPAVVVGQTGQAELAPGPLQHIVDTLHAAGGPLPLDALLRGHDAQGAEISELLAMVSALVGLRAVAPAQDPARTAAARPATRRLNAHLLARVPSQIDVHWLASPVTGGAVPAAPTLQATLLARAAAPDQPDTWAARVWQTMQDSGQQLLQGEQPVLDRAAALELLAPVVDAVQRQGLKTLQRLQVID